MPSASSSRPRISSTRIWSLPWTAMPITAARSPPSICIKPDHKSLDLGGRLVFPTEHMVRAIEAARAGKTILGFPVYDGSENGEKVFNTLTVIGKKIAPGERNHDDAAANEAKLADVPRWPVTISYFDKDKSGPNRRAEARLCDRFRALRQRHLAGADARLQRFHRQRETGVARISRRQSPASEVLSHQQSSRSSNASPLITASSPKRARTRSTACSASAARPSTRSAGSASFAAASALTPTPSRR